LWEFISPRLKFKVLLNLSPSDLHPKETCLTKFLSASNQIVKDLDCSNLPPEGRKNVQPASKLCVIRFASSQIPKSAHQAITARTNYKNFVLY